MLACRVSPTFLPEDPDLVPAPLPETLPAPLPGTLHDRLISDLFDDVLACVVLLLCFLRCLLHCVPLCLLYILDPHPLRMYALGDVGVGLALMRGSCRLLPPRLDSGIRLSACCAAHDLQVYALRNLGSETVVAHQPLGLGRCYMLSGLPPEHQRV